MIKDRKRALKNETLSSRVANSAHETLQIAFTQESFAGPDLCPSCVERLSVEDTWSRLALNKNISLSSRAAKADTRLHMHAFSQ